MDVKLVNSKAVFGLADLGGKIYISKISHSVKLGLNNANLMRTGSGKEAGSRFNSLVPASASHPTPTTRGFVPPHRRFYKPKVTHCAQIPPHTLIKPLCPFQKPDDWQSLISHFSLANLLKSTFLFL